MVVIPFGRDAKFTMADAFQIARESGHGEIKSEHLLLALIRRVPRLFSERAEPKVIEERVQELLPPPDNESRWKRKKPGSYRYTERMKTCMRLAKEVATRRGADSVSAADLLGGILTEWQGTGARVLVEFGFGRPPTDLTDPGIDEPPAPEELVELSDDSSQPFSHQIVAQIKEAVAEGRLIPGERIPSVRRFADALDIAPGTVARAFKRLEDEAIVTTDGARGTRVAAPSVSPSEPDPERLEALVGLIRPTAVAAFHMGASAAELRNALEIASAGVFGDPPEARGSA